MHYNYKTKDTCATDISFDVEDRVVKNIVFTGGCNGNLKAIPLLIDGWKTEDVIAKLEGVKCGRRPTSCADQLASALRQATNCAI